MYHITTFLSSIQFQALCKCPCSSFETLTTQTDYELSKVNAWPTTTHPVCEKPLMLDSGGLTE